MLALAYKRIEGEVTPSALRHMPRDQAEHGLRFAGERRWGREGGDWGRRGLGGEGGGSGSPSGWQYLKGICWMAS